MLRWVAIAWMGMAVPAAAEVACPPQDLNGCNWLALSYSNGLAPFPEDARRAEAHVEALIAVQRDRCASGDWWACGGMVQTVWSHPARPFGFLPEEADVRGAVDLAIAVTGEGCDRGAALACLVRTLFSGDMALPTLFHGEWLAWDDQRREFLSAAISALRADLPRWLSACGAGDFDACRTLTSLTFRLPTVLQGDLAWMPEDLAQDIDRIREELWPTALMDLLLAGCRDVGTGSCAELSRLALRLNPSLRGVGILASFPTAVPELEDRCRRGIGDACLVLGHLADPGQPGAIDNILRACEAGQPDGCLLWAWQDYQAQLQAGGVTDLQPVSDAMAAACAADRVLACGFLENLARQ